MIDDILMDLNRMPSINKPFRFSTNAKQQIDSIANQSNNNNNNDGNNNNQQPKSSKQKKKVKKEKKDKKANAQAKKAKETVKTSKRAVKLAQVEHLPDPEFKNGIKSTLVHDIQSTYNSHQVEWGWDTYWNDTGYYTAKTDAEKRDSKQSNFVMVIPPPNVTGSLHLGHALMATIEDVIVRYQRMKGKNCLWLPGTDHAGIATQTVVERQLARDGKTRHDLGREAFLKQVWLWKEQKGGTICSQLRRMGCSVDWSREVFTMDEKLSRAVTEAFVRLYEQGLIYRDKRLCHWSCSLQSAISDVEIDKIEIADKTKLSVPGYDKKIAFGVLHKFGYQVCGSDEVVTVATTRLETMLGDTAVAIHPADTRYKHLHGQRVQHPFFPDRTMPIICDDILVDMAFGTGCVKITPAHDPNDFECGQRHGLEFINILNDDGTINEHGGQFAGMKRYDVRYALIKELTTRKLFFGEEKNPMVLDQCSRSKDIIEPLIKPQWYMNCDALAQRALDAVFVDKTLRILPQKEGEQQWQYFLGNIRKWCISRQLWWGHRIPAYYIAFESEDTTPPDWDETDVSINWFVGRTFEEANKQAQQRMQARYGADAVQKYKYVLKQDEDVLDTWFSSGLFPFSTMGWPSDTADLQSFFPGDLLETGGDILFFWVARMAMMSLALMEKLPFHTVYLHPMVKDEHGAKMSKSSGNVIDPLHIVDGVTLQTLKDELYGGNIRNDHIHKFEKEKEKKFPHGIPRCGADALRFGLSSLLVQRSINLNVNTVIGYRMFCNKIWNATKLALTYIVESEQQIDMTRLSSSMSTMDQWIISRLYDCIASCDANNRAYEFGYSTQAIYQFFYHEFCPIYLEAIKPTMMESTDERAKNVIRDVLYFCLCESFKLMHPFMPFVTEELYQRVQNTRFGDAYKLCSDSLMVARYPDSNTLQGWNNDAFITEAVALALDVSSSVRSTKQSQLGLSTKTKYAVHLFSNDDKHQKILKMMANDINTLSMSDGVFVLDNDENAKNNGAYFMSAMDVFKQTEKSVTTNTADDDEQKTASMSTVSLYSVKEKCDTIYVYSAVKGLVNVEQRIKKFNKETTKLQSMIDKTSKSLLKIDKEDIRKKTEEKLKTYQRDLNAMQDTIKQLQRL